MDLLQPGQVFAGRYRIERLLAQGGMGAVFVAEQLATELQVALKVLFPQVLSSPDAVERFQLEARVAARVKSEHIVAVLDGDFDDSTRLPFLVMELLSGDSLESVVQKNGPLAPAVVCRYVAQCSSALDRAHGYVDRDGQAKPIVHRDLKPENLFIANRETGDPIVKILDFGIAKVLSETSGVSRELKGTPLFMAYEQAGGQAVTPQTDIWALGLIAFFSLTGQYYWLAARDDTAGLTALFGEVLSRPLVTPTQRAAELGVSPVWGGAFDQWFARCVNRDPLQRFPSAGEAANALAAALDVRGSRSNLDVSRPVLLQSDAAARSATSLTPAETPAIEAMTANTTSPVSVPPRSGARRPSALILASVAGLVGLAGVGAYVFLQSGGATTSELDAGLAANAGSAEASAPQPEPTPAQDEASVEEPAASTADGGLTQKASSPGRKSIPPPLAERNQGSKAPRPGPAAPATPAPGPEPRPRATPTPTPAPVEQPKPSSGAGVWDER